MTKVAVVTGAAHNIGKGITKSLIEAGYKCVLLDNNEQALQGAKSELEVLGECHDYVADVGNVEELKNFHQWLKNQNINVDVLVNNVGYDGGESFLELTPDKIKISNQ